MKIIALGDSFTRGFLVEDKAYTRFLEKAGISFLNMGVNGSTTRDMLERFRGISDKKADYLIVFGGTNDFLQGAPVDFVIKNLKSILDLQAAGKTILILPPFVEEEEAYGFYEGINSKISALKDKISALKDKKSRLGVDIIIDAEKIPGHYLDGVHMGADFHKNLADEILRRINWKI